MATINYTPGQILHIESSVGPWYYISFLHCTKPRNRIDESYALHTCCDLCIDPDEPICLTLARGNGSLLDNDTAFENIREATNEEKLLLYDTLVKAFKEHDSDWDKYFTDSTYDDIRDWLYWEFDVDIDNMDNDNSLVDTIYEITNYIWDALCKETGNYQACTDYVEPVMVNKQEFSEKTWQWLKSHIKFKTISYNDVWDMSTVEILATDFTTVDEMEESFRKIMEE